MKRTFVVTIIIALIISVVYIIWYTSPKQHHSTFQGVLYEIGNESNKGVEPINIEMDGKLRKSITGQRTFIGTLEIEGEVMPIPPDYRDVVIKIGDDGWAPLVYAGFNNGRSFTYGYGIIFLSDDFSKVTIIKGGWSEGKGIFITAPATNRTEALQISNELMSEYLKGSMILN